MAPRHAVPASARAPADNMSELDAAENKIAAWLQPLPDDVAPCGPDLEYDNDFLALQQAAAGKPESQFGAAEPPDWRAVSGMCERLFERTRDLRIAVYWLRAGVHLHGYGLLGSGLKLVNGLIDAHWQAVHPLPDPDDGDPYARVNALTVLREVDGLIGDLRESRIVEDRAIGILDGRMAEVSLGLSPLRSGETERSRDQLGLMLADFLPKAPELRARCAEAAAQVKRLMSLCHERLGIDHSPDFRPLWALVSGILTLLPAEAVAEAVEGEAGEELAAGSRGGGGGGTRRGLSGSVTSREEAVRAIDLVCEYLERAEPANPAPLFLRRARQLINHNFLQLMKVLAPDSLAEVARVVGIDPDAVESPDGS